MMKLFLGLIFVGCKLLQVKKYEITVLENKNGSQDAKDFQSKAAVIKPEASISKETAKEEPDIVIITRDRCGYSSAMRALLEEKNVKYKDINVSVEGKAVLKKRNLEGMTYPMVIFNGKYIGGLSDTTTNKEFREYLDDPKNKIRKPAIEEADPKCVRFNK